MNFANVFIENWVSNKGHTYIYLYHRPTHEVNSSGVLYVWCVINCVCGFMFFDLMSIIFIKPKKRMRQKKWTNTNFCLNLALLRRLPVI